MSRSRILSIIRGNVGRNGIPTYSRPYFLKRYPQPIIGVHLPQDGEENLVLFQGSQGDLLPGSHLPQFPPGNHLTWAFSTPLTMGGPHCRSI